MKKIFLILLITVMFFGCSLFKTKPNKEESKYKYLSKEIYNNETYEYSVLVPKNWTNGMNYGIYDNVRFDELYNKAFMIIMVKDVDELKPNKLIEGCIKELNAINHDFKIDKIIINKVMYDHLIYSNNNLNQSIFITTVNDYTYLIVCFVPPNTLNLYEELFIEFISSITFPTQLKGLYKENIS